MPGSGYGQASRIRSGHVQRTPVHTGIGRDGFRVRHASGEVLPRRQDNRDLRRHVRDPEDSHRRQHFQRARSVDYNNIMYLHVYFRLIYCK